MSAILVLTPSHVCDPQIAIAACRAGETGLLDLGFGHAREAQERAIAKLAELATPRAGRSTGRWGVRWDRLEEHDRGLMHLRGLLGHARPNVLLLAGLDRDAESLAAACIEARELANEVLIEVNDLAEAQRAAAAGFSGVVVKGHEGAGRVSGESSFLLLQRLFERLAVPYWLHGGVGPDTATAAFLAGAAGVVLCEQLWLATESPFDAASRKSWGQLDGSETVCVSDQKETWRFFSRSGKSIIEGIEHAIARGEDWRSQLHIRLVDPTIPAGGQLIPLGQEIGFARRLADKYVNVAGILKAYRHQIERNLHVARQADALAAGGPLAKAHGTEYPILQGPMTRVSDVAPFCRAVSENGGLPFLALALMNGDETRKLLLATQDQLDELPWGVGMLGFVPLELRNVQMAAVNEVRPKFAIIAGGRPSQARELEERGTCTYLHVPSPGLLEIFIKEGARKFIFEGRECGGHVGPRTSFALWQSAIDVLCDAKVDCPDEFQIVFAGGIHDALSAAMVAAAAARLSAVGMKIGVLMGTGYLFTHEAVECGAITDEFQRQALSCDETVLLESGVGHATRCVKTAFADEFNRIKYELMLSGKTSDEIRFELEMFNIGRLRVASKGVDRRSDPRVEGKSELVSVDVETQRKSGMYMIGQVAGLRHEPLPMADFHAEVANGGAALLDRLALRELPWQKPVPQVIGPNDPIAVVGMSCLFPQAKDVRQYWQNIVNRVDAIEEVPADRWRADDFFDADRFAPDRVYSKWGGFLGKIVFDPVKWRIPPAALMHIEPIQLLALEVASRAMQDAGYDRRDFPRERAGVIFACAGSHELGSNYCFRTMMRHYLPKVRELSEEARQQIYTSLEEQLPDWTEDSFPGFLLNVVAGRIARELNLNGPNYTVDAACAASMAALHAAVEQLRMRTSDLMLVGGADATNNPFCYMSFSKTHALSPRGRSRAFDETGDGISLGEGIAVVVLKRLADAERDGDKIYAVIRGVGSSSDGKNRSLTAPHPPGQIRAVERAYADAEIAPQTVSLVEAHGTGTVVGDSAEITTLTQVFGADSPRHQYAAIGSVKSMIGHTKTVAGIASLVKTILALKHRVLPPTIGVETPTSRVDFGHSPFYINTESRPWVNEMGDVPRRAGVSSFGFGGTNFHVVLEEYTGSFQNSDEADLSPRQAELFCWGRGTRAEVLKTLGQLAERLKAEPTVSLPQLGASIQAEERKRPAGTAKCRLSIIAETVAELTQKLDRAAGLLAARDSLVDPTGIYYSEAAPVQASEVCFLYPGQGSQSVNMLSSLLLSCRWGHALFDRANQLLADFLPQPLSRYIYPPPVFKDEERQQHFRELSDTRVAQPALGLVELFATEWLARFGVRPGMVAGHSYGEHVALQVAGCLSQEDLLWLSAMRGRVCADAAFESPGGMVSVQASADVTRQALEEMELPATLANLNAPDQTIIAGLEDVVRQAEEQLNARGIRSKRIPVSAAFHSPLLEQGGQAMAAHFAQVTFHAPRLPVYSNTTGAEHAHDPHTIRTLLTRHFSEPVLFEREVRQMYADGARVFIEVGPGKVLCDLVKRVLPDEPITTLPLDARGRNGWTQSGHLLAQAYTLGLPIRVATWFERRSLAENTVEECLAQAHLESHPKPTDWIIGPAAATPVTPLPPKKKIGAHGSGLRAKFGGKSAAPANGDKTGSNGEKPLPPAAATPGVPAAQSSTNRVAAAVGSPVASNPGQTAAAPASVAAAAVVAPTVAAATVIRATAAPVVVPTTITPRAAVIHPSAVPSAVASRPAAPHTVSSAANGSAVAAPVAPSAASVGANAPARTSVPPQGPASHMPHSSTNHAKPQNASLAATSSPATMASAAGSPIQRTSIPMSNAPRDYSGTGNRSAGNQPSSDLFSQFQATTRMLLELQNSQQRVVERYLETQERVLYSCLQGAPAITVPTAGVLPASFMPAAPQPVAIPAAASVAAAPAHLPTTPAPAVVRPPVSIPAAPAAAPAAAPRPVAAAPAPVAAQPVAAQPAPVAAAQAAPVEAPIAAPQPVVGAAAAGGEEPPARDVFQQDLLQVVSERTGYPIDMLDIELPLEAGLGIDSIKTVEIFSNLKEYHRYFRDQDQDEEELLAEFTKLKTLRDIIDSYDRRLQHHAASLNGNGQHTATPAAVAVASPNGSVERYTVAAVDAPLEANGSKKKVP